MRLRPASYPPVRPSEHAWCSRPVILPSAPPAPHEDTVAFGYLPFALVGLGKDFALKSVSLFHSITS